MSAFGAPENDSKCVYQVRSSLLFLLYTKVNHTRIIWFNSRNDNFVFLHIYIISAQYSEPWGCEGSCEAGV